MLERLQKYLTSDRKANAYLLVGDEQSEKETEASGFAQALLCPQQGPCQSCPSCRRFLGGNHPDFLLLEPQKGSLKIEQIREILGRILLKPVEGGFLIVLIREADRMTEGAANALLKTLEEPPSHALFLLTSSVPERLPATIRSRCQRISFFSASGNLGKWEEPLTLWRQKILPTLAGGNSPSFATASELAEELLRETDDPAAFIEFLQAWWSDLACFHETQQANSLRLAKAEELTPLLIRRSSERIFKEFNLILETGRALTGNVLKQLALERLFLHLM